jgi:hypothetical protein
MVKHDSHDHLDLLYISNHKSIFTEASPPYLHVCWIRLKECQHPKHTLISQPLYPDLYLTGVAFGLLKDRYSALTFSDVDL